MVVKKEEEPELEDMEAEECGVDSEGAPEYDRAMLPDLLRVYYRWLFPYDKYFAWLQYGVSVCVSSYMCVLSLYIPTSYSLCVYICVLVGV